MKRALLLVLAVAASACYHYVPPGSAPVRQGTPVRMELQETMSFEIPAMTFHNINRITGEMVRRDFGDVVVSALWLDAITGQGYSGQKWTIRIPEDNVSDFRVRRISTWRTAGILAAGVVATYLGFESLRGNNEGGQPGEGGQVN